MAVSASSPSIKSKYGEGNESILVQAGHLRVRSALSPNPAPLPSTKRKRESKVKIKSDDSCNFPKEMNSHVVDNSLTQCVDIETARRGPH